MYQARIVDINNTDDEASNVSPEKDLMGKYLTVTLTSEQAQEETNAIQYLHIIAKNQSHFKEDCVSSRNIVRQQLVCGDTMIYLPIITLKNI